MATASPSTPVAGGAPDPAQALATRLSAFSTQMGTPFASLTAATMFAEDEAAKPASPHKAASTAFLDDLTRLKTAAAQPPAATPPPAKRRRTVDLFGTPVVVEDDGTATPSQLLMTIRNSGASPLLSSLTPAQLANPRVAADCTWVL